jgi:hypothetical protein
MSARIGGRKPGDLARQTSAPGHAMRSVHVLAVLAMLLSPSAVAVTGDESAASPINPETPGSATLVLMPVADATVNNAFPSRIYGNEPYLGVHHSGSYEARSLIKFDLYALPRQAFILDAELRLYCLEAEGVATAVLSMVRITDDWSEDTVTWNSDVPYNTPGSAEDVGGADEYYYFDATVLVDGWHNGTYPNWGMMIRPQAPADNTRVFASRERSDIYPQLTITYREPTHTPRSTRTRTRTRTPRPTDTRTPVRSKTATRTPSALVTFTRTPTPPTSACTGDCNDDGRVAIDELVRGVTIALGIAPLDGCAIFDRNANGRLTVDELVAAVDNALNGCAEPS